MIFSLIFSSGDIQIGLDIIQNNIQDLKNKKIGIIANHTSLDSKNQTIVDIMLNNKIDVIRIFAPEHGYLGHYQAGQKFQNSKDLLTDIEIVSLYGKNKSPQDKHLNDLDILIFDIQDIGVRYYTYVSTMILAMEKAAENDVQFVVLDRPNPLSGKIVQGSTLNKDYSSFVGMLPIPVRHGMTIGEIALFVKNNNLIESANELNLKVVKMINWNRLDWHDSYWDKWTPPSPNIPNRLNALIYVGACLLEGTNVSEGRGTEDPFILFGAPWIDSQSLVKNLNNKNLKGIYFVSESFIPNKSKYSGLKCNGLRINIIDEEVINPFTVGMHIINEIYKKHPNHFEFKADFFDKLYGSDELRLAILKQNNLNNLIEKNDKDIERFVQLRTKALLY